MILDVSHWALSFRTINGLGLTYLRLFRKLMLHYVFQQGHSGEKMAVIEGAKVAGAAAAQATNIRRHGHIAKHNGQTIGSGGSVSFDKQGLFSPADVVPINSHVSTGLTLHKPHAHRHESARALNNLFYSATYSGHTTSDSPHRHTNNGLGAQDTSSATAPDKLTLRSAPALQHDYAHTLPIWSGPHEHLPHWSFTVNRLASMQNALLSASQIRADAEGSILQAPSLATIFAPLDHQRSTTAI